MTGAEGSIKRKLQLAADLILSSPDQHSVSQHVDDEPTDAVVSRRGCADSSPLLELAASPGVRHRRNIIINHNGQSSSRHHHPSSNDQTSFCPITSPPAASDDRKSSRRTSSSSSETGVAVSSVGANRKPTNDRRPLPKVAAGGRNVQRTNQTATTLPSPTKEQRFFNGPETSGVRRTNVTGRPPSTASASGRTRTPRAGSASPVKGHQAGGNGVARTRIQQLDDGRRDVRDSRATATTTR